MFPVRDAANAGPHHDRHPYTTPEASWVSLSTTEGSALSLELTPRSHLTRLEHPRQPVTATFNCAGVVAPRPSRTNTWLYMAGVASSASAWATVKVT